MWRLKIPSHPAVTVDVPKRLRPAHGTGFPAGHDRPASQPNSMGDDATPTRRAASVHAPYSPMVPAGDPPALQHWTSSSFALMPTRPSKALVASDLTPVTTAQLAWNTPLPAASPASRPSYFLRRTPRRGHCSLPQERLPKKTPQRGELPRVEGLVTHAVGDGAEFVAVVWM